MNRKCGTESTTRRVRPTSASTSSVTPLNPPPSGETITCSSLQNCAYGVGEHSDARWGERYGEGSMAGKRAMLIVTTGGWESHYSPRGINGPIDDVLFPIQHGVLYYPGFDVLPPFVIHRTSRIDEARFSQVSDTFGQRLDDLWKMAPIPFRPQNAGAYDIPELTLRADVSPDQVGFAAHIA